MKTIYFIFESEKSLDAYQNIIRDILYLGYGLKIESCLEKEVNLDEIIVADYCFLIFTEVRKSITNGKCMWLIGGLSSKDILKEINQLVLD